MPLPGWGKWVYGFAAAIAILVGAAAAPLLGQSSNTLYLPFVTHSALPGYVTPAYWPGFVANAGQFDPQVRYYLGGSHISLSLLDNEIWFTVWAASDGADQPQAGVVKLRFVDANPQPGLQPFEPLDANVSYFLGDDPGKWQAGVPLWRGVRYVDLYPGVDLEMSVAGGRWQWRLLGRDQGASQPVPVRVEGGDGLSLLTSGQPLTQVDFLDVRTGGGPLRLPLPQSNVSLHVEGVAQSGEPLAVDLKPWRPPNAAGPGADAAAGMAAPQDNPAELVYSTVLGGSEFSFLSSFADDAGLALTLDANRAIYVTGYTYSPDFPKSPGALDSTCGTDGECNSIHSDGFVAKLSPDGRKLQWVTFLGGSDLDQGMAIAVDATGAPYIAGDTYSADFPTKSAAAQEADSLQGPGAGIPVQRAFVAKLAPNGATLVYAKLLGHDYTAAKAIAVDATSAAYVTGTTADADFPTTAGSLDRQCNTVRSCFYPAGDAFVTKLQPSGQLAYSTFLGGDGGDQGAAIVVDAAGTAYVGGATYSADFPTTAGAYDRMADGWDGFVVRLKADGSAVLFGTVVGGSGKDEVAAMAVGSAGAVYLAGQTSSEDFATTPGALDRTLGGGVCGGPNAIVPIDRLMAAAAYPCRNAFVTKLNAGGTGLVYSTYLGGAGQDDRETLAFGLAVDSGGRAYIAGWTSSADFPTTAGAFDRTCQDLDSTDYIVGDAFVVKLEGDGSRLAHSTCLGGTEYDWGYGIAVDSDDVAYVAGVASVGFPTTVGAYDTTFNGGFTDVFIAKLALKATAPPPSPSPSPSPTPIPTPTGTPVPSGPPDPKRVAYIYSGDTASRDSFRELLGSRGLTVDLVSITEANQFDFSRDWAVIVGADTGAMDGWLASASHVAAYGRPVVGVGTGGYGFFSQLGLAIGSHGLLRQNYIPGFGPSCEGKDLSLYYHPEPLPLCAIEETCSAGLYATEAGARYSLEIDRTFAPAQTRRLTQDPDLSCAAPVSPLVAEGNCHLLWGFGGPPSQMTELGRSLFVNALYFQTCGRPKLDLTVEELEVTQGLQDGANSVPLVRGRRTVARAYVQIEEGPAFVGGVTGRLLGYSGDAYLGAVKPFNRQGAIVAKGIDNPANLDDALNFELPKAWTARSSLRLVALINYERRLVDENDYGNNSRSAAVTLHACRPITVAYVPIRFIDPDSGMQMSPDRRITTGDRFLRTIYPFAESGLTYRPWSGGTLTWALDVDKVYTMTTGVGTSEAVPGSTRLLRRLLALQRATAPRPDYVFGWLHGSASDVYGWAYQPGTAGFGLDTSVDGRWRDTFAHEMGHSFGRPHTVETTAGYRRFDVYARAVKPAPASLSGGELLDIMQATAEPPEDWVSYNTYRHVFNRFCAVTAAEGGVDAAVDGAAAEPLWATPDDVAAANGLEISGLIWPGAQPAGRLDPLYRATGTPLVRPAAGAQYCLALLSQTGTELARYCFELPAVTGDSAASTAGVPFLYIVPYPAGLDRVELRTGANLILAARTASGHAPTVQVLSPNEAGRTLDGVGTVRWAADDVDGNPLTFQVAYSADNGAHWTTLAADLAVGSTEVDFAALPGTAQGLIKVRVSDGFHSAEDACDRPFAVPGKAPDAIIVSPPSGVFFNGDGPVPLQGVGLDLEEGTLGDAALAWTSDVDGALGQGRWIEATLSPDIHRITLTATDAAGRHDTDSIFVVVSLPSDASQIYLPLVTRGQ